MKSIYKKAILWRLFSMISTISVVWLLSGSIVVGGMAALVDGLITTFLLYPLFEWWWTKSSGSPENPVASRRKQVK